MLNSRSICNKVLPIKDWTVDNHCDFLAITETWLKSEDTDGTTVKDLCPTGYNFIHQPRLNGRGGGVSLLYRSVFQVRSNDIKTFSTFEYLDVFVNYDSTCLNIIVLYRPPNTSVRVFIDEFSSLLEQVVLLSDYPLIVGDFNIHVDNPDDSEAADFDSLLNSFGLCQMVHFPTHCNGHTLDLVLTKECKTSSYVTDFVSTDPCLSDHLVVMFKLPRIKKRHFTQKRISYRKLKSLDGEAFQASISDSFSGLVNSDDLCKLVDGYSQVVTAALDRHAPLKSRVITIRPRAPWYTEEIAEAKKARRRAERRWRRSKESDDRLIYVNLCKSVNAILHHAKSNYYTTVVSDNKGDQKFLFTTVNKLLHRNSSKVLPSSTSDLNLAEKFADFFINKVATIHDELNKFPSDLNYCTSSVDNSSVSAPSSIQRFQPLTSTDIEKIIKTSPAKSCSLDPMPTTLLKDHLCVLLPVITKIVNMSLDSVFPPSLKNSIVTPLLKKPSLDPELLKNYRPVSNLTFISKTIERAVANQLNGHLLTNNLHEAHQSAYKRFHSTETALLKVHNDILVALDERQAVFLLLLDLSAAFDTVNHSTLLSRLQLRYGITGQALFWLKSYLCNRTQTVSINNVLSSSRTLDFGVPQGSVLGPILFSLYTAPITDIICSHGLNYHLYADDTQLYLAFDPACNEDLATAKLTVENCVADIRIWMSQNHLKLNDDKSELLVFHSRFSPRPDILNLTVGDESITPSTSCRNIGVVFDDILSFGKQVNALCKTSFWHLRNIWRIRTCLDKQSLEIVVHAFITNKLDFCNSILIGLPKYLIKRLQSVQNCAARLVCGLKKHEHISPILSNLHWLPVEKRITYKVLLIVFKCLNGLSPQYLSELLIEYKPTRTLRSCSKKLLVVPRVNTKRYGERAFSVIGPRLWNSLPQNLRDITNLEHFKKNLKTYLFKL